MRTHLVSLILLSFLWSVSCYDPCYDSKSGTYGQILAQRHSQTNETSLFFSGWDYPLNVTDSTGCYSYSIQSLVADSVYRSVSSAPADEHWFSFSLWGTLENLCSRSNTTPPFVQFYTEGEGQISFPSPDASNEVVLKGINVQGNVFNENMTAVNVTIEEAIFSSNEPTLFTDEREDYENRDQCIIRGRTDSFTTQVSSRTFNFTFNFDGGRILIFNFPAGVPASMNWRNFEYYFTQCPCVAYSETDGTTRSRH